MLLVLRFLLPLFLLATPGCLPGQPAESNEGMQDVLGALQVHGVKQRDEALAGSCRNAADRGFPEAVLLGIPRIENKTLRDEVAADCAQKLHDRQQAEAAGQVAALIANPAARERVRLQLNPGS